MVTNIEEYVTAMEAGKRIGISRQRMCLLCQKGRVVGANYDSKLRQWSVPWPVEILSSSPRDGSRE